MGDKKKEGKKASQAADDEYDYLYKVVVIGDSSVGKSNLLSRFTKNEFFLDSRPTIGVEFAAKNVIVDSKIIKAQIWDTAGQERFRAITEAYYRRAVGALLVYDITRRSTFINLQHWLDELYLHSGKSTVVILVGNKSDLGFKREVSTEEGKVFAEKNHLGFLETSALEATNVGDAFNLVIAGVYEEMGRKSLENRKDAYNDFKGVVIPSPPVPSKEKPNNNPCCG